MNSKLKTAAIGLFVLVASLILVSALLFIHPSIGDNAKKLTIRFTDVDKIDVGTRVTYAGRPVGEVTSIKEIPEARKMRIDYDGDVYIYEVKATVDSSVNIYNTDEITVRTSGLLGEKSIEINPMPAKPGEKIFEVDSQVLYATPVGSVESTLKSFSKLTRSVSDTLNSIQKSIDTIQTENIVEGAGQITKNLVDITDALNRPEKWRATIDHIAQISADVNETWQVTDKLINDLSEVVSAVQKNIPLIDDSFTNISAAAKNLNQSSDDVLKITKDLSSGKGSIGKLLSSDQLYLQIESILHKGFNVMSDINRFGLLFQTNKRWQRLEAQRRNMLATLSDPSFFDAYFNREMGNISTSISNISMILNQTEQRDPKQLYFDPEFTTSFYNLLKQVKELEENIQLFNEELIN